MKRRTLLAGTASSAAALAGCIGRTIPGGEPVGNATNGSGTDDGGTTAGDVAVAGTQLEVLNVGCGTQTNEASVSRDEAASEVVVEGTISAPNPCHTAKLGEVTYDASAGELRVPITTEERPDTDVCSQCIAEIEYRAVVQLDGGLPASVVVTHGDEVVAESAA